MWVIVLLLLIGGTIVCVRVFRNGALGALEPEEPEPAERELASPPAQAAAKAPAAVAAAPETTVSPEVASAAEESTPEPPPEPVVWPGGPCPACSAETVPAAKFCGECGQKLTANS